MGEGYWSRGPILRRVQSLPREAGKRKGEVHVMLEFLSTYGIWIVFAVIFLLMMRMHGSGMGGCCGGQQNSSDSKKTESENEKQPVGAGRRNSSCH